MKMNILSWNFFWGVLLILWGSSLILRSFNIFLPLAKIFIALIIILFGIKLLLGNKSCPFRSKNYKDNFSSKVQVNRSGDYNMIFASGIIDLSDIKPDSAELEINVVFGSAEVLLPSNINFDIDATAVFGKNVVPRGINRNAGDSRSIHIDSNAIFGQITYNVINAQADSVNAEEVPNGDF